MSAKIPNHVENHVCRKNSRGKPLTDDQEAINSTYSKTRCRIEHIFGFMTGSTKAKKKHEAQITEMQAELAKYIVALNL